MRIQKDWILIIKELEFLARGLSSQKFEVFPVSGGKIAAVCKAFFNSLAATPLVGGQLVGIARLTSIATLLPLTIFAGLLLSIIDQIANGGRKTANKGADFIINHLFVGAIRSVTEIVGLGVVFLSLDIFAELRKG
jgi:hypothetical protein